MHGTASFEKDSLQFALRIAETADPSTVEGATALRFALAGLLSTNIGLIKRAGSNADTVRELPQFNELLPPRSGGYIEDKFFVASNAEGYIASGNRDSYIFLYYLCQALMYSNTNRHDYYCGKTEVDRGPRGIEFHFTRSIYLKENAQQSLEIQEYINMHPTCIKSGWMTNFDVTFTSDAIKALVIRLCNHYLDISMI